MSFNWHRLLGLPDPNAPPVLTVDNSAIVASLQATIAAQRDQIGAQAKTILDLTFRLAQSAPIPQPAPAEPVSTPAAAPTAPSAPPPTSPTGGGSPLSQVVPAQDYPSAAAMIADLKAQAFSHTVSLDGNALAEFAGGFGPALPYYTKADGGVSRNHPAVPVAPPSPPPPPPLAPEPKTIAIDLPWGTTSRDGSTPFPRLFTSDFRGDDLLIIKLSPPATVSSSLGSISLSEYGGGPCMRYAVISTTPGDFAMQPPLSNFRFATDVSFPLQVGGAQVPGVFLMQPGVVYYLNLKNQNQYGTQTVPSGEVGNMSIDFGKPLGT